MESPPMSTRRQLRMAHLRGKIARLSLAEATLRQLADDASRDRYEAEQELLALVKETRA